MSNEISNERKVFLDFTPATLDMTNYDELKKEVENYAKKYSGLVFTADEKSDAMQVRSDLLGLRNAIESERKHVKQIYNKPLDEFEGKIKKLIETVDQPLTDIREGLTAIDEAEKEARSEALDDVLAEKLKDLNITLQDIEQDARWLNKGNWTAKLKPTGKLESEIDNAIAQAVKEKERKESEVRILTEFCKAQEIEAAGWVSQLGHKSAMEVIDLINLDKKRREQIEEEQEKKRIEREAFIQEQKEALKDAEGYAKNIQRAPEPVEKKHTSVIRVTGTIQQLKELNNFLVSNGIGVEEVKEDEPVSLDDLPW